MTGVQASNRPASFIALHNSGYHLAVGGEDNVSAWKASQANQMGSLEWDLLANLPLPPMTNQAVRVTSLFWANQETTNALVVSYQFHGVV